jgi:hypothetical protein
MFSGTAEYGKNPEYAVPQVEAPVQITLREYEEPPQYLKPYENPQDSSDPLADQARLETYGPRPDARPPRSYLEEAGARFDELSRDPRLRIALYVAAFFLGIKMSHSGQSLRGYEFYPAPPKEAEQSRQDK